MHPSMEKIVFFFFFGLAVLARTYVVSRQCERDSVFFSRIPEIVGDE
jgi:hypothetical protein